MDAGILYKEESPVIKVVLPLFVYFVYFVVN
jgi:hypothetical protein